MMAHGGMGGMGGRTAWGSGGQFFGALRSTAPGRLGHPAARDQGHSQPDGQFARPYRTILIWFLVLVVVDAVIGVINPLLFRSIIDKGIPEHDKSLIVGLALVAAGLAVVDTGALHRHPLGLGQGRRGAHLRHAVQGLRAHPEDADRLLHPHPDRAPSSAGSTTT